MERYKYAGKKLIIAQGAGRAFNGEILDGKEFIAEDYWMNVSGKSWKCIEGNPAVVEYICRAMANKTPPPMDDYVIYGKVGLYGHLFHENELIPLDEATPVTHELKICRQHYEDILSNRKKFEVRKNDRNYQVGDFLVLHEFHDGDYTDRCMPLRITYILDDPKYCKQGYVIMSVEHTSVTPTRIRSYPRRRVMF